ncbi:MAG: hypothetical protein L3J00_04940 [Thiomicrorhabdus sp.]|nr:hypothetical protein [Thiomicrorhabdus sp.]
MLANYRDKRCKNSVDTIAKSLDGNYKEEHLFALKQAVELYDMFDEKIKDCDQVIEECLKGLNKQADALEFKKNKSKKRRAT